MTNIDWDKVLTGLATGYLYEHYGKGYWSTLETPVDPAPEDCLDVKTGDTVYYWDDHDSIIEAHTICAVVDQVPFIIDKTGKQTQAYPATKDFYYKTVAELKESNAYKLNKKWLTKLYGRLKTAEDQTD